MASNTTAYETAADTYDDWIEIYNASTETVDLDGYYMTDDLEDPTKNLIDGSLTVEPGGFLILIANGSVELGPQYMSFKLSAGGEELGLYSPGGTLIDSIRFGQQETDFSLARAVDGSVKDGWEYVLYGTPGTSNHAR